MSEKFDYYKAPEQEVFDDIKRCAIAVWQTYDNTYGYVDEKVNQIKDIKNIKDNAGYIIAMFDGHNQRKLYNLVSDKTKKYIENCWELSGYTPL